jgi:hypothetical protein
MQVEIRQLVQAIHDCQTRIVLVTAGAGTQALSDLKHLGNSLILIPPGSWPAVPSLEPDG